MPAKTVKRESPYLCVGTTIYKRVRQPLSRDRHRAQRPALDGIPDQMAHRRSRQCDERHRVSEPCLSGIDRRAGKVQDHMALEPMLSRNIIKLQITDNHILSKAQSKSKSF